VLPKMQYNRVGRTDLQISVVGFGTCQLRLVPEPQAIATLLRGFELGVNWGAYGAGL
jgi:aryl-alcohol dehydrogenase-like predicted oxidoreductase